MINKTVCLLYYLLFLPFVSVASQSQPPADNLATVKGRWQVVGVRLDETLMRRPAYNIDDPELMGRVVVVSSKAIQTNIPGVSKCQEPSAKAERSTLDLLVNRTMGKVAYSEEQTNKFSLPVDTTKEIEVLWMTCKKGHIGPDTPFGPRRYNWIARISSDGLAMRWYDNTILLLKRVKR